ncbi:hypothetical protein WCLP8_3990001 [uncultured Gammaproteobacteria bacterium]
MIELLGRLAKAEAQIIALTEEIVRLKDLKGRPKLKASGMEKGTGSEPQKVQFFRPKATQRNERSDALLVRQILPLVRKRVKGIEPSS